MISVKREIKFRLKKAWNTADRLYLKLKILPNAKVAKDQITYVITLKKIEMNIANCLLLT